MPPPIVNRHRDTRRWLVPLDCVESPALSLFLLPHAGAGASMFRGWRTGFASNIELCAIQLPGRESRFKELPFRRMGPLIEELTATIGPVLDRPFAVFGHSMGAAVAFELSRCLRERTGQVPLYIFVSGYPAPRAIRPRIPAVHTLSDSDLASELQRLGTPQETFSIPELLSTVLPTLRADFEVIETWAPQPATPLSCPILAIRGCNDAFVTDEALDAWRYETTGPFDSQCMPGDHFYHTKCDALFGLLARRLEIALARI
jgi:medium-chain acyl-[acyl-carrier-protein] hydrolase